jgi:hypothetical protein
LEGKALKVLYLLAYHLPIGLILWYLRARWRVIYMVR